MSDNNQVKNLLEKYYTGDATLHEVEQLTVLLTDPSNEVKAKVLLEQLVENTTPTMQYDDAALEEMIQAILAKEPKGKVIPLTGRWGWFRRIAVAASVLLVVSIGSYLLFAPEKTAVAKLEAEAERFKNDVAPGGNKAILTLAGGKQIVLDSSAAGELAKQGNTRVIKLDEGKLSYITAGAGKEVLYNTITTPKGGQYQLVLSEGTKVWLNSASSLKFPAAFSGGERRVELTGEGYFEVVHDAKNPFFVKAGNQLIEDIGTAFNVNAYDDEATPKTTLLEGSVRMQNGQGPSVTLIPGQQGIITKDGSISINSAININEVMAWKNGLFQFDRSDLKAIMRQVARWYDVEVVYEKDKNEKFIGTIPRDVNVSKLLQMLELTGHVRFRIEGKKVTVID